MTDREFAKLKKTYIDMVTSPQFSYPPSSKTKAEIDWLVFSIAIETAFPK